MKKIFFVLFFIIDGCIVFSQNDHGPLQNALLWKITGNGLKQPSYLFGTMHILCEDDAKLSDSLIAAIKDCNEVYFEIDMSDMMGMVGAMKMMQMSEGKKLSDLLSPADYSKVKAYFEKHPSMVPFGMLEHFKPMLISSLVEESALPCSATDGMELEIMKKAKVENKKINGLETATFQASLFDSIPYIEQAKDLVKYLDSGDQNKKMMDSLSDAYNRQDLRLIEDLTNRDDGSSSHYMDLLLYRRNRKWVSMMQQLLPTKSFLFAVGAGHLPGEKGLIKLLRQKGYRVEAMKAE